MPMQKSTVPGTCVATCAMLWHGEPVGSLCAIRKADFPRVLGMVHCRFSHLCCYFVYAVGHVLWVVAASTQCEQWNYVVCVGMSMFLLMSKRIVIPRVISLVTCRYSVNKSVALLQVGTTAPVGCAFFGSRFAALC